MKKSKNVAKFGGVDALGDVSMHGHTHEASSVEAKSQTNLESDKGEGDAAIIRRFTFGVNILSFKERPPTNQDLFNNHLKGIEMALWKDGMTPFDAVPPRLVFNTEKTQYHIFIAARPMKGHLLRETPQTLSELAHG